MMQSDRQIRFGTDKRGALPTRCIRCKYLFACNGECPKHRFNRTESGDTGLNALCEGYKLFYSHVDRYMGIMRSLLEQKRSPAGIMALLRFPGTEG